jgi:hypothetical protein
MSRIARIARICRSLANRGWSDLFHSHGLNLRARDLESELSRKLDVDRGQVGFQDFCADGDKGIEPGDPARSLLYHALASPDVLLPVRRRRVASNAYPSLQELDEIENYIYSLKPFDPVTSEELIVGVFAYEYRPAASSAHGYHADFVFSRTGVARVGTNQKAWYGPWRSFRPDPHGQKGISVCPARYGAFIAKATTPDDTYLIPLVGRRDEQNDSIRTFYYPVHKLFSGGDCIQGANLTLGFQEYHRNEKLRKLHVVGDIVLPQGFDVNAPPFVRDSINAGGLVRLVSLGDSILVVPRYRPTLVRTATQINSISRRKELVRFVVPSDKGENRFSSSLQMLAQGTARLVPEYVNIRHRARRRGNRFIVDNLGKLNRLAFEKTLKHGGYEAVHFIDDTCDGALTVSLRGLGRQTKSLPAYSLVAAPVFFPLADQLEISNWVRRSFINFQEHFAQGSPWPLCEGRRAANLELPRPDSLGDKAFDRKDDTLIAIVGLQPRSRQHSASDRLKRFSSHLTDAASNEFDPGWDVSLAGDDEGAYLAAYGLGSPFPEDAKLCAALNSFWPAAAPDASRTFAIECGPTAMPLLDCELGYHPGHPLVRARKVKSSFGWDGEQGPFFEKLGRRLFVNAANIDRSDYVSNALTNKIDIRKTSGTTGGELVRRMDALRRCIEVLPPKGDWVSHTRLWLVSAVKIENWTADPSRAHKSLSGGGYVYVFADFDRTKRPTKDLVRDRYRVVKVFECQISDDVIAFRRNSTRWRIIRLPNLDARHDDQLLVAKRAGHQN